jgi:hypothetical protein
VCCVAAAAAAAALMHARALSRVRVHCAHFRVAGRPPHIQLLQRVPSSLARIAAAAAAVAAPKKSLAHTQKTPTTIKKNDHQKNKTKSTTSLRTP